MTTDQSPTTITVCEEEPEPTPIPSFLDALRALRDWGVQTRFDAGFSNSLYGWTGSLALDDLVSQIDDVQLAFMVHGETGKFPSSLLSLRTRALNCGGSLRAEIVRDAISCAITEMRTGTVPTEGMVDEAIDLALTDADPNPSMTLDGAWELATRALGVVKEASADGWVKTFTAIKLFEELAAVDSLMQDLRLEIPPAYMATKTAVELARIKLSSHIQSTLLEQGLKSLAAAIADVKSKA